MIDDLVQNGVSLGVCINDFADIIYSFFFCIFSQQRCHAPGGEKVGCRTNSQFCSQTIVISLDASVLFNGNIPAFFNGFFYGILGHILLIIRVVRIL